MKQRLAVLEVNLGKRHSDKVRLRLEEEATKARKYIEDASEVFQPQVFASPNPPKPRLLCREERPGEYRKAIKKSLDEGGQVLVLAPEISFFSFFAVQQKCG